MNAITVINSRDESLTLVLRSPVANGLAVDSVTGVGPELAEVSTTSFSSYAADGDRYAGSRMEKRNVVLTLIPMEPDVEGARLLAYKYFPITELVRLIFASDHREAYCVGYVEKITPTIFSSKGTIQISIICPDPYFYQAGEQITHIFSGYQPMFQFPFTNPLREKTLQFGMKKEERQGSIVYTGERPIGCVMDIYMMEPVKNILVYHLELQQKLTINTDMIETIMGDPIQANDMIRVSSITRDKYVRLLRDGVWHNVIGALDLTSTYITLIPGVNTLAYDAEEGVSHLLFSVMHNIAYGGL